MRFGFLRIRRRVRRVRRAPARSRALYALHKEYARALILERLAYWNQFYGVTYNRVSIRDQRSRWGSCSTKGNLNFNYRIAFLPLELRDYIIVHELCHRIEFNHSPAFWAQVARAIPDYFAHIQHLRTIPMKQVQAPAPAVAPLAFSEAISV